MTATLAVALAAAVAGPLAAYITASRKLSGKIGTSEASELWAESKAIRDDCRERLAAADARITDMQARLDVLERENRALREQLADLQRSLGKGAP